MALQVAAEAEATLRLEAGSTEPHKLNHTAPQSTDPLGKALTVTGALAPEPLLRLALKEQEALLLEGEDDDELDYHERPVVQSSLNSYAWESYDAKELPTTCPPPTTYYLLPTNY